MTAALIKLRCAALPKKSQRRWCNHWPCRELPQALSVWTDLRFMAFSSRSLAIWSSRSLSMCRSRKGRLPPSPACEALFTEAVDDQFIRGGDRDKLPAAGIEVGHRVGIPAPVQLPLPENFPGTGTQSAETIVVG